MKLPRLKISSGMFVVAIVAINLTAIRAFKYGIDEGFVFSALPTVNILVFVGIAGFRRWRAFTVGFVVLGSLSLLTYQIVFRDHPWMWLNFLQPPIKVIAHHLKAILPISHENISFSITLVLFAAPHTVLGLAGGYLTAKGRAMMKRRYPAYKNH